MCEQMLDRHIAPDERKVVAENRTGSRRELEPVVLDQAHDGERRHALHAARDREAGVDLVRDLVPPVRETVGLGEHDIRSAIDANDARKARLGGDRIERELQRRHRADATRWIARSRAG